ncbi:MAG: hypothetical protein IJT38_01265 [Clostridia bacterium]|nr:hypothetical protein [Clostridia bacterium]
MKYINQKKYPDILYVTRVNMSDPESVERGRTTTISSSGCGLCSAVMVASRLIPNCNFELKDAIRISYDNNANHQVGTDYKIFAPAFAERCGLDLEMTNDTERLRFCLRTGGAAVLHIKGDRDGYVGVFSHKGHYVAAISEERDGRIAVLDPSLVDGKYDEEGRRGLVELKNNVVALCDMQVIEADTKPANPSYYLFWRK